MGEGNMCPPSSLRSSSGKQGFTSHQAAMSLVRQVLCDVLRPDVPPSFAEIRTAHMEGKGRRQTITAHLVMLDGLPATVRLSRWAMGWSHQWLDLPGGDLSFENGAWVRIGADGEPVLPLFSHHSDRARPGTPLSNPTPQKNGGQNG